ncbi:MAG TPA: elongation factor P--(R)-beta-lysine ligase [Gammaproteobacteria bacterium]|nr:elongation factor P--(R)-beta-lysine ligase [Gammaproteobacteria bacterium]
MARFNLMLNMSWQPTASIATLQRRAEILARIRRFFAERNVLEVETPLLSSAGVSDIYLNNITASIKDKTYYLQTSPEYAMKRLICAGSGSIYQICKAFRQDEVSKLHNPEFTMIEWYRMGMDHHALMDEVAELLQLVLNCETVERYTYKTVFQKYLNIDPHEADIQQLKLLSKDIGFSGELDKDGWLQLLMGHTIEPELGKDNPVMIYDFPASQAALAKIRNETPPVASRFEIYYKGIELGNGFHELQDAKEQRARFEKDLAERKKRELPSVPLDEHFLKALEHGLPDCSGVAVGIDRLIMLALNEIQISKIMSFDFDHSS